MRRRPRALSYNNIKGVRHRRLLALPKVFFVFGMSAMHTASTHTLL